MGNLLRNTEGKIWNNLSYRDQTHQFISRGFRVEMFLVLSPPSFFLGFIERVRFKCVWSLIVLHSNKWIQGFVSLVVAVFCRTLTVQLLCSHPTEILEKVNVKTIN